MKDYFTVFYCHLYSHTYCVAYHNVYRNLQFKSSASKLFSENEILIIFDILSLAKMYRHITFIYSENVIVLQYISFKLLILIAML